MQSVAKSKSEPGRFTVAKPLQIEEVRIKIHELNFQLLSQQYLNSKTPLLLRCSRNHEFELSYSKLLQGRNCPHCSGSRRYTDDQVRRIFSERGLEMLGSYRTNKSPILTKCERGHTYKTTLVRVLGGNRCPECAGNKPYNLEDVQRIIKESGYELLSSEYKNNQQPLSIFCDRGHTYTATFHNFRAGHRCVYCRGSNVALDSGLIRQWVTERGLEWIGGQYLNNNSELQLRCPKFHEFTSSWRKLQNHGCPQCSGSKLDYQQLALDAQNRGYRLITESTQYRNRTQLLDWYCPQGHHIQMSARNFKRGGTCAECADRYWTLEQAREVAAARRYRILSAEFPNATTKIEFACPQGHTFFTSFAEFNRGRNCRECRKYSIDQVRTAIALRGYALVSTEYENSKSLLHVRCSKNHDWNVMWNSLQQGADCPRCQLNRPEAEIEEFLRGIIGEKAEIRVRDRSTLDRMELDFYLPRFLLAVEHCGLYFHSTHVLGQRYPHPSVYHKKKMEECRTKGIRLITLFGDEWQYNRSLVESKLRHLVGHYDHKVYPRSGVISEIEERHQIRDFLNYNHLQGSIGAKLAVGFKHNGQLLALITYGRPNRAHVADPGAFEIKRMAVQRGYHLPGVLVRIHRFAMGKLREMGVKQVVSFCDLRWSDGKIYPHLGMILSHESDPSPHKTDTHRRYSVQGFTNSKSDLLTIYDCGHQKWVQQL